jgi:hypothetical protein
MKRVTLLVAVCLGVAPSLGVADEKPGISSGVPPFLVTVGSINRQKGEIGLRNRTVRFVWEPNRRAVYEEHGWTLTLASTQVFDVKGKKLTSEELWKRIAAGAVVAVSADGKEVDPGFLKAFAKDTLVFVSAEYAVNHVTQQAARAPALVPGDAVPAAR